MALDIVMVSRRGPRHHLLAIDVWNQSDVEVTIDGAKDLVSPFIVSVIDEHLSHCELKMIKLSILMVELWVDNVLL